ncbi:RdgB/HAM1 family non-canonical purine NTP pyrophosphatase [Lachnospiraceae bacterium ZAX-1]
MKKKLIFATGNEKKMEEIRAILSDATLEIVSMKEVGIDIEVVEDGETFMDNAIIKATAIAKAVKDLSITAIVLADDSGLEIDYLNKEPGVYSARYEGVDTPYTVKNKILLERLSKVEKAKRTARFVCAIAAVRSDGEIITAQDTIEGYISLEPAGEHGFGYDPIFYVPEHHCTSAQLPPDIKNKLSHRGKALRAMKDKL